MAEKALTALGKYLENARHRQRLRVTHLMRDVALSRSTWYSLIEGRADHRPETIRSVAAGLGVDVDHALSLAFGADVSGGGELTESPGTDTLVDVSAGRELADLSEAQIADMISAGVSELRRRAERHAGADPGPHDRTPALAVAQPA
jgi:hypothetical protein